MPLIIQKKIKLLKSPLNLVIIDSKIFVSTKSNKVIETNLNLSKQRSIVFKENINSIIQDGHTLICLSKNKSVCKYNILTDKKHYINIKYDISYIKKTDNNTKYLLGLTDGKVLYSTFDFNPIRMLYGCTAKILEIVDDIKGKLFIANNKFIMIDIKTGKLKIQNINFTTSCCLLSKKTLVLGTDNGIFLYDTEKDRIINKLELNSPVSCLKILGDKLLVGCENGVFYIFKISNFEMKLIEEVFLYGIINFIETVNNVVYIGVGKEERNGAFGKNRNFKNLLYKCIMN